MRENNDQFFLQRWCEQTTQSITQLQQGVTTIMVTQEEQHGRLQALEKTEKTAKWAVRSAVVAVATVVFEYMKNHMWR